MSAPVSSSSASILPIAQITPKVHLQESFKFLDPLHERACCYRVCRSWFSACKTDYSSNITDYGLTSQKTFSWVTVEVYINSINSNPLSPRKNEVPTRQDSSGQYAMKVVAIVQKAARSITHLSLNHFYCWDETFEANYAQTLSLLFPNHAEPARFPHVIKFHFGLTVNLPQAPFDFFGSVLHHLPALREISITGIKVANVTRILSTAPHSHLETARLRCLDGESLESPAFIESLRTLNTIHMEADCETTDEQIVSISRGFQGLKLRSISLFRSTRLTDSSLEVIRGLPELEHLEIFSCGNITEDGILSLKRARKLHSLRIDNILFRNRFPIFSTFPALQTLIITHLVGAFNIEEIGKCHLLHTLEITRSISFHGAESRLNSYESAYLRRMLPNLKTLR